MAPVASSKPIRLLVALGLLAVVLAAIAFWPGTDSSIKLGLDLQGGSHVMLEVDKTDIINTQVKNLRDDVRRILREEKVGITGGIAAYKAAEILRLLQDRGVRVQVDESGNEHVVRQIYRGGVWIPFGGGALRQHVGNGAV